ncbi:YheC/YheD family protein [Tumebacillus permanentifrigoris]|uniref:YheC/D-like protein n=1 Tax=Tumebacillus permanentifrigoris TaxID=378543 RepID=A0A316DCV8_9BACL|nr:YheC/YheD family protein [Tumebacillus permanentifrigoris]PWK15516.1 YheC/D-like protein [Tumebacillus permanentifrigoris]
MANPARIRIDTVTSLPDGLMFLPRSLMKSLQLSMGSYRVAYGGRETQVHVRELTGKVDHGYAQIAESVRRELLLPEGVRVELLSKGTLLRLGYVLGVLANVKAEGETVLGQQALVFKHLLTAAEEQGMTGYVFSPLDIDWKERFVTGYSYDTRKRVWRRRRMPLPDAIYDQVISRTYHNRADVAEQRERLFAHVRPRAFNPDYFDKSLVHNWLAGSPRTKSLVPDAITFKSITQASQFLYRYPDVYMKPIHGSLGIGIMRLRRKPDGQVYYQMKKATGSLTQGTAGSISEFLKKFAKRLRTGPYLIQETLHLKTWQGRPFDIRLLLQKGSTGKWNRTKTFCRIAQDGDITSNLSTGGDAIAVRALLKEILPSVKAVNRVMRDLIQIAEDVPAVLEATVEGSIGELGLDLGLDENGKIWVIEINAKPWKKPNIEEGEWRELSLLAFQRPVQYAKFLCQTTRDH